MVQEEILAEGNEENQVSVEADSEEGFQINAEDQTSDVTISANEDDGSINDESKEAVNDSEDTDDSVEAANESDDESDSVDTVVDEAVEESEEPESETLVDAEEITSEASTSSLEKGTKVNVKFKNTAHCTITGSDEDGKSTGTGLDVNGNLEVTVGEQGNIAFICHANTGYMIQNIVTNIPVGFIPNEYVSVYYGPETGYAYLPLNYMGYEIPSQGLEITIETVEATKITLSIYGESSGDYAGAKLYGNFESLGEFVKELNEDGSFVFDAPKADSLEINSLGKEYGENNYTFYINKGGALGEKLENPFTVQGTSMSIYAVKNPEKVVNTISGQAQDHAYIGTAQDPNGKTFNVESEENKDFVFYVKCDSGYVIDKLSYIVNEKEETISVGSNATSGKYTIPKNKITGNVAITVSAKEREYTITNTKGNYLIKTMDGSWSDTIKTKAVGSEPFAFMAKPKKGYYVYDAYYTVNKKTKYLQPNKKYDDGSFEIRIPKGFDGNVNIEFLTKKQIDLSKTKVSLYFGDSEKASTEVAYDAVAANNGGIIPSRIVVKDEKGKVIDPDYYTLSFENNEAAGTAYVRIKPDAYNLIGTKVIPYRIKGISMADTKKIQIEVKKPKYWNNSGDSHISNIAELVVTDISDPNNPIELKGSAFEIHSDNNYVVNYFNSPIDYENNIFKPGEYTLTVIGLGGYEGSRTIKYNIPKPSLNNANKDEFSIQLSEVGVQSYTGKAIKPKLNIAYNGINLVEGRDYELKKYGNNTNPYMLSPGDAGFSSKKAPYVTIVGKGNYQGTKTIYFKIDQKDINDESIKVQIPIYKFTGRLIAAKPVVTMVVDGKVVKTFKEKTDYTLEYENNTDATDSARVKIIPTEKGCLKVVGDYTCREESFTIASNNIADSKIIAIALSDAEGEPSSGTVSYEYTGSEIKPSVLIERKVLADGFDSQSSWLPLEEGKDYKVSYSNNINVGKKATVTITGIGQYYGSVKKTFTINSKVIHAEEYDNIKFYVDGTLIDGTEELNYDYTGYAIKPTIVVKDNLYSLKEGIDYTLSYSNNTSVSTGSKLAAVTVKFKGNYAGLKSENTTSKTVSFKINSWNLGDSKVSITVNNEDKLVYTSKAIKPQVTVLSPDGRKVNPKVFKLTYANNINANETASGENVPTVKISPVNKYITAPQVTAKSAYVSKTFAIKKADFAKIIRTIKIKDYVYKGKEIEPKITIKFAGKTLKQGVDYEVEYFSNDSRGLAVVTFTTNKSKNFTIRGSSLSVPFTIK